ncbi:MAG: hypothetical protein ABEJ72_11045, partial [Candidatus Aenigmatarchaeota archaeon]
MLGKMIRSLKTFYLGQTVEDVRSENLYGLLNHPEMNDDPFTSKFERYDEDSDEYTAVYAKGGRKQEIVDTVMDLEEEMDEELRYDVDLNFGDF